MNQQNELVTKQTHPSYERLTAVLAQRGVLRPSEIAKALGEVQQTVKNWETRGVSRKGAMAAQEVFGIDVNWLATGEGTMQPPALPTSPLLRRADVGPAVAGGGGPTPTIETLLVQLGDLLMTADDKTRAAVADLLLRYAQNPADGERLAQAIGVLLNGSPKP